MEHKGIINLRLLYIEDEDDTLEPMTRFLQRRFSKVVTAKDGNEGLRKFNEYHPDIIITDLLLPENGGIDLIENIVYKGSEQEVINSFVKTFQKIVKNFQKEYKDTYSLKISKWSAYLLFIFVLYTYTGYIHIQSTLKSIITISTFMYTSRSHFSSKCRSTNSTPTS